MKKYTMKLTVLLLNSYSCNTPKSHNFVSFTLQSQIFKWNNILKHISFANVLTGITIFFIFYIIRTYVIPSEWFFIKITLLEDTFIKFKVYKDLLLGVMAVISRLFVLGFWQEVIKAISPENLPFDSLVEKPSSFHSLDLPFNSMDKGQNPEAGSSFEGKGETAGSTNQEAPDPIMVSVLADLIQKDTKQVNKALLDWGKELKSYNDSLPLDQLKLTPQTEEPLLSLLRSQSTIFTRCVKNRMVWVLSRGVNMLAENEVQIKEIHSNLVEIQAKYHSSIDRISKLENKNTQVKELYANLNQYRNQAIKELNKAETIVLADIRTSPLSKYPELKKVLNAEFTQAKKEFNNQDGYLKMKVGQILNAKK